MALSWATFRSSSRFRSRRCHKHTRKTTSSSRSSRLSSSSSSGRSPTPKWGCSLQPGSIWRPNPPLFTCKRSPRAGTWKGKARTFLRRPWCSRRALTGNPLVLTTWSGVRTLTNSTTTPPGAPPLSSTRNSTRNRARYKLATALNPKQHSSSSGRQVCNTCPWEGSQPSRFRTLAGPPRAKVPCPRAR